MSLNPQITHPSSAPRSPRPNNTRTSRHAAPRHLPGSQTLERRGLNGSLTQTITPSSSNDPSPSQSPDPLVLRLRGARDTTTTTTSDSRTGEQTENGTGTSRRRGIQWAEDVIDNEGLGRKSSKVCCIYHKNRDFGESSSEDDSSSDDSDDSGGGGSGGSDDGSARTVGGGGRRRGRRRGHEHRDGEGEEGDCGHAHRGGEKGKGKEKDRRPSPNAYERMPKYGKQ